MLIDQLKARMMVAMKAKDTTTKETMRTAIGEVTKTGEEASDERVMNVLRKMSKSNEEAARYADGDAQEALKAENALLAEFLPKSLTLEEVLQIISPESEAIIGAKSAGQATGIAMKALKKSGKEVDGKTASQAVRKLRGET